MKLGISSFTYTWAVGVPGYPVSEPLTPTELIGKAVELGVGVVQICDNMPAHDLDDAALSELSQCASDNSIAIELGVRGSSPRHMNRYLDLALRLDASLLRVVLDTEVDHASPAELVRRLNHVVPRLRGNDIRIGIENHDRFKARDLVAILQALDNERVGICLDTVNSFGALEGPEVVVSTLGPWTINLHIKEFAIYRPDHKMGFVLEGRPVGEGQLNVPWLLASLRPFGREMNAILELWTPPEKTVAATVAKEDRWVRQSVRYLRELIPD